MEKRTGRIWSKPLGILAIVGTLVLCLFAVAYSRTDIGKAASNYPKFRSEAQNLGLIETKDELAATYSVSEEDNAAEILKPVLAIARKNKWDAPKLASESVFRDKWSEFEQGLAAIEKASGRKHLLFKRNLSNPAAITFPEFSDIRAWIRALSTMARFSTEKGDPASAKHYLTAASYLANAQDEEGTMIGDLVRVSGAIVIETEVRAIIQEHGREQAWRDVAKSVLDRLNKPYDIKHMVAVEHYFAVSMVDIALKTPDSAWEQTGGSSGVPTTLKMAKFIPRFREASMSRIEEAYVNLVKSLPSDPYDFVSSSNAFGKMDEFAMSKDLSFTMLGFVAPVYSQTGTTLAREVAYRNALFQALALCGASGNPDHGLPLGGRYRLDLDGKPLRLKHASGGWIVYSIGPDRVDDGGKEMKDMKGDWVVHLPK